MKLTEKEKEMILKIRATREQDGPKKVGITKHNLFVLYDTPMPSNWIFDENEKSMLIEQYSSKAFKLAIPAGTRFVCYIVGGESWYDDINYGVENMSAWWARENLINIRNIRRKKS